MKKLFTLLLVLFLTVGFVGAVNALTVDTVSGTWSNPIGGSNISGIGTSEIRWGYGLADYSYQNSGFGFAGNSPNTFDIGEYFSLGTFTHYNFPTEAGSGASSADLSVYLSFSDPAGLNDTLGFTFAINETSNSYDPPTNPLNNDIIGFPSAYASETFEIDSTLYTLQLLGFGSTAGSLLDEFSTIETQINQAQLWARVTTPSSVPEPATMLLLGTGLIGLAGFRRRFKK